MANYLWFVSQICPIIFRNGNHLHYLPQVIEGLQVAETYQKLQETYEMQMKPLFVIGPEEYYQIYCNLVYSHIVLLEQHLCQENLQYVSIWKTCIALSGITNNPEGLGDLCITKYMSLKSQILGQAVDILDYQRATAGTPIEAQDVKAMVTLIQSIIG
jgi:hypothetical protein